MPWCRGCDWCRFRLPCQAPHAGTVCAATALHDDISSWLQAAASINPATSLAAACPRAETGLGQCCAAGVCWHLLQRCAYHHSGTVRGHTGHGLGYRLGHGGCGGSSRWRIAQWTGAEARLVSLVRQIVACGCACRASCCHPVCAATASSRVCGTLLVAVRCFICDHLRCPDHGLASRRFVMPYSWSWSEAALLGSILSATDPVAGKCRRCCNAVLYCAVMCMS